MLIKLRHGCHDEENGSQKSDWGWKIKDGDNEISTDFVRKFAWNDEDVDEIDRQTEICNK